MIFLTVGTQLSFDRLVQAVDTWAAREGRDDVLAQIGPTTFQPKALKSSQFLAPEAFDKCCRNAQLIIAHAGMGSIISAIEFGLPIIVMPRLARLGEHRSDHQVATANEFRHHDGVWVADDVDSIFRLLARVNELTSYGKTSSSASEELICAIRDFIDRT